MALGGEALPTVCVCFQLQPTYCSTAPSLLPVKVPYLILCRDLSLLKLNMKLLFLTSPCVFSSRLNAYKTLTKLIQTACLFFFRGFVAGFGIPEVKV